MKRRKHVLLRKLLGFIDRSLERIRRTIGALSEAPAIIGTVRCVRVTSL